MGRSARPERRGWWRGRRFTSATAVMLVLALVLLAGSAPAAGRPTMGNLSGQKASPTSAKSASSAGGPVRLGPTDPSRPITVTLSLAGQSQADLARMIAAINDPRSPEYHHYLTPEEYARRFGPSAAPVGRTEASLRAAGLTVAPYSAGSRLLSASGTVGQVEALFGVKINDYRDSDGVIYYAPDGGPRLPAAMVGVVVGVLGLDNRPLMHRAGIEKIENVGTSIAGHPAPRPLAPTELKQAYNIQPLISAGLNGSGQTMAFAEIDTFKQSDITTFDSLFQISGAPQVEVVRVDGGAAKAKDVSETTLDIEVAHAVAPQTHLIAYEGPADFGGLTDTFSKIVNDNRAQVVSISLGGCEPAIAQAPDLGQAYLNTLSQIFQQAAAQGMTVLVASGDSGAYTCRRNDPTDVTPSISLPADNPYVTAVGGTALFVNDDGSYGYEAGWEGPLEGSGGGGGLSMAYPTPSWQSGPGVANQYSNGNRQVPDVSASADPMTGYQIYDTTDGSCGSATPSDCLAAVGGTSAATPLWGALVVLANQQAAGSGKKSAGFINPLLYQMGRGELGASPFHDVTQGGNLYYPATSDWDYSTGWGTPDAAAVVKYLVAQAPSK